MAITNLVTNHDVIGASRMMSGTLTSGGAEETIETSMTSISSVIFVPAQTGDVATSGGTITATLTDADHHFIVIGH